MVNFAEKRACTAFVDRECEACETRAGRVCQAGQYLVGCGYSAHGECKNCSDWYGECTATQFLQSCGGTSRGSCETCEVSSWRCGEGEYLSGCGNGERGACLPCSEAACGEGEVRVGCGMGLVGQCEFCGAGRYLDVGSGVCKGCGPGTYYSGSGTVEACALCPRGAVEGVPGGVGGIGVFDMPGSDEPVIFLFCTQIPFCPRSDVLGRWGSTKMPTGRRPARSAARVAGSTRMRSGRGHASALRASTSGVCRWVVVSGDSLVL
eukprot:639152-Hanusia_phi.AAC.4